MESDGTAAPMPRWVKVSGALLMLLALVVVILHLTGNDLGGHAP